MKTILVLPLVGLLICGGWLAAYVLQEHAAERAGVLQAERVVHSSCARELLGIPRAISGIAEGREVVDQGERMTVDIGVGEKRSGQFLAITLGLRWGSTLIPLCYRESDFVLESARFFGPTSTGVSIGHPWPLESGAECQSLPVTAPIASPPVLF